MTSIIDHWWAPRRASRSNPARLSREAEIAAARAVLTTGVREVAFAGKRYTKTGDVSTHVETGTIFRVVTADKKVVWVLIDNETNEATTHATYRAADGYEARKARTSARETPSEINARIKRLEDERRERLASGRISEEAQLMRQARYGTTAHDRFLAKEELERRRNPASGKITPEQRAFLRRISEFTGRREWMSQGGMTYAKIQPYMERGWVEVRFFPRSRSSNELRVDEFRLTDSGWRSGTAKSR